MRGIKLEDTFLVAKGVLMVFVIIFIFTEAVIAKLLVQGNGRCIVLAHFQTHIDASCLARCLFASFNQFATKTAATQIAVHGD